MGGPGAELLFWVIFWGFQFPRFSGEITTGGEGTVPKGKLGLLGDGSVQLLRCPGANVSGEARLFREFFLNYGLLHEAEQLPNTFEAVVRFVEGDPACSRDFRATSTQSAISEGNNSRHRDHEMLLDGWIVKQFSPLQSESIPPNKYCVQSWDDDEFTVKYCRSDCGTQPCISKCCYEHQVCDLRGAEDGEGCTQCVDSGRHRWKPEIGGVVQEMGTYSVVHYHAFPGCNLHYILHENSTNLNFSTQNNFKFLKNGTVVYHRAGDDTWFPLPEGTYCVDGAVHTSYNTLYSGDTYDTVLHICRSNMDILNSERDTPALRKHQYILYTILVPFGVVFILLTIVVFILTWQEQNIHGYSNFAYLITLLVLYVFIVLGNVRAFAYQGEYPVLCPFIAGGIHFAYLSSTCWVTCISYDVWRQFHKMNHVRCQTSGRRRFTAFCLFSVGYPLVHVGVCAILDAVYMGIPSHQLAIILPNYGRLGIFACTMSNDGVTYYLYIPISILIVCNVGFFIATILNMKRHHRSIRAAFAEASVSGRPSKANQSFGIYTRLFIIMDIFWISQIISWFVVLKNDQGVIRRYEALFAVVDAITVMQAVATFYIFVCKRSVFISLWRLHPWLRPCLVIWVKNGCCAMPTPAEILKGPHPHSTVGLTNIKSKKGSSGNTAAAAKDPKAGHTHRSSTESTSSGTADSPTPPSHNASNHDALARHSSDFSQVTEVSDVEEKLAEGAGPPAVVNTPGWNIYETKV